MPRAVWRHAPSVVGLLALAMLAALRPVLDAGRATVSLAGGEDGGGPFSVRCVRFSGGRGYCVLRDVVLRTEMIGDRVSGATLGVRGLALGSEIELPAGAHLEGRLRLVPREEEEPAPIAGRAFLALVDHPHTPYHLVVDFMKYFQPLFSRFRRRNGAENVVVVGFTRHSMAGAALATWPAGDLLRALSPRPLVSMFALASAPARFEELVVGLWPVANQDSVFSSFLASSRLASLEDARSSRRGRAVARAVSDDVAAAAAARVLLVQRAGQLWDAARRHSQGNGRIVTNIFEVERALVRAFPLLRVVALEAFPTLEDQVAELRASDVVVMIHGSAAIWGGFLPATSVLVEVRPCARGVGFVGSGVVDAARMVEYTVGDAGPTATRLEPREYVVQRDGADGDPCRHNVRVDPAEFERATRLGVRKWARLMR